MVKLRTMTELRKELRAVVDPRVMQQRAALMLEEYNTAGTGTCCFEDTRENTRSNKPPSRATVNATRLLVRTTPAIEPGCKLQHG